MSSGPIASAVQNELSRHLKRLREELDLVLNQSESEFDLDTNQTEIRNLRLLGPVIKTRRALREAFTQPASGADEPERNAQSLAFRLSGNIPEEYQLNFFKEFLPEAVWSIAISANSSNFQRDMLIYYVVSRKSIKGLLESEFGCSPEAAQQAEMLVREFLRATQGIELPEEAPEGPETAALSLPDAPPAYPYVPRMEGGILKYLEDNWAEHIKAGVLTRPALKQIDEPAWVALNNWLRNNVLPPHLHVPSRSEIVDRALSAHGLDNFSASAATQKLLAAAAGRQKRDREPKP